MVSIFQNVVNIVCSLSFVYLLGMKVEGVALGTLVAQYSGFALSLWLLKRQYGEYVKKCSLEAVKAKDEMKRFFVVNGDIFVRTLFLVAVNFMFTATGAKQGAVVLAVNTLMYQFSPSSRMSWMVSPMQAKLWVENIMEQAKKQCSVVRCATSLGGACSFACFILCFISCVEEE